MSLNPPQRLRQFRLPERIPFLVEIAVVEEDTVAVSIFRQIFLVNFEKISEAKGEFVAVLGEKPCRFYEVAPCDLTRAVFLNARSKPATVPGTPDAR